jgi:HemY protein
MMMAEIEEGEHGDQGRVRAWLTRAFNAQPDPAWVADGQAFDHWAPVSPISGRVDAFEWKVAAQPLGPPARAEIETGVDRPDAPPPRREVVAPPVLRTETPKDVPAAAAPKPGASVRQPEPARPPAAVVPPVSSSPKPPAAIPAARVATAPKSEPPPMPRAPDDPGPEPATADPDRPGFRRS